jgi:Arc/MetJ-type ribon-helix-helix transcriptional regulator
MTDAMVSVRMPKSMFLELKELSKKHHFLDLSELIRGLTRKKWIRYTNPELFELKKLREDIELEVRKKSIEKVREEVNKELEKIRSQIKKGNLANEK